ncbi:hypothetical protein EVAR_81485_1 [Eumeta japonica]|uniref:Uncharacterized protein n=1 Tax=Eumeta variegata TaxID=151549 RepID=A0A4C1W3S0_EUMVA|nr:hypothetical protein EVAR_81485_1 [Eumeta japonica]
MPYRDKKLDQKSHYLSPTRREDPKLCTLNPSARLLVFALTLGKAAVLWISYVITLTLESPQGSGFICTPTATYEARAVIKKSDHLKTLSIILPTHRKNPYSEATVQEVRGAGICGDWHVFIVRPNNSSFTTTNYQIRANNSKPPSRHASQRVTNARSSIAANAASCKRPRSSRRYLVCRGQFVDPKPAAAAGRINLINDERCACAGAPPGARPGE